MDGPSSTAAADARATGAVSAATRVRWIVLGMLFAVTTINFAARATLSIAGPDLRAALGLSPVQMGYIFSAFAWSYVLAQLPGGWLLDRFGSKTTYVVSLTLWSLFTMLQGAAGLLTGFAAVALLFAMRLAVGAAEAPSFPGNGRITSAWFPANERGLASAIFNAAQYFATAFFAPLMGWLVYAYGWASVFYVVGGLGLAAALAWNKVIYGPLAHPWANPAELEYIRAGGALVELDGGAGGTATRHVKTFACLGELLGSRMLLGLYIFQYCINALTYFFLTWFPLYLVSERHMTILKAGFVASLPAICGFAGGVLGGWASDRLIKAGWSLTAARKAPIVAGLVLAMSMAACNVVTSDALVVALMSLAFFGKGLGALGWAVVADTSPNEAGGLSGALFNTFGNAAGITTPIVVGYILQTTGSFAGALTFVALHAAVGLASMLLFVGTIRRVELKESLLRVTA